MWIGWGASTYFNDTLRCVRNCKGGLKRRIELSILQLELVKYNLLERKRQAALARFITRVYSPVIKKHLMAGLPEEKVFITGSPSEPVSPKGHLSRRVGSTSN